MSPSGGGTPPDPAVWTSDERTAILRAHSDQLAAASRESTLLLAAAAQLAPGLRVLDIACGPGDPTFEVAGRVAPGGTVTGIDLSPGALGVARERADRIGSRNVAFECANAESLPFPDEAFDRVVSRYGFMFFDDLPRVVGEVRRVLRPGGRLAVMVWGPFEQPYFQNTIGVLLRRSGRTGLPADRTVQFRYAAPGALDEALASAGFSAVRSEVGQPRWVWKGTPEQVRDEWVSTAVYNRPLIEELSEDARRLAWQEIADGFRTYFDGEWVRVPLAVRVISAERPLR
jgi:ubiquinone/menaquinone biosynthesis C-methylase UbiE